MEFFSALPQLTFGQSVVALVLVWLGQRLSRFWWLRAKYDMHRLPSPPELPIIGHAHLLVGGKPKSNLQVLEWSREYGDIFRLNVAGDNRVIVHDINCVTKEITTSGENDLPKSNLYDAFRKAFVPGTTSIFMMKKSDKAYKSERKVLMPAFSTKQLKIGFPKILMKTKVLSQVLKDSKGKSLDMQELLLQYTFDCIGLYTFDSDMQTIENGGHPFLDAMCKSLDACMEDIVRPHTAWYKKHVPFSRLAQDERHACDKVVEYYIRFTEDVLKAKDGCSEDDQSLGACIMRLGKSHGKTLKESAADGGLMFMAGTDTTSHELAYGLCMLSENPEVQIKMRKEIEQHGFLADSEKDLTYRDLSEMKYVACVVKEILRFFPVPIAPSRVTEKDMVIKGYRIPKGTTITCSFLGMTRSKVIEDPDDFKPERWETISAAQGTCLEDSIKNKALWSLAFSHGRRDCVGQRLAMMEMQICLIEIVRRFHVKMDPKMGGWEGVLKKSYCSLVSTIEGGAWLSFTPHA